MIIAAVLFAVLTFNTEAKGHYNGVSGYFYTELAPYGSWIEIDYGVVVWRPTIIRTDWVPYTMGRWIWTYDGWYWDSYEPFGYITFHYGRWFYDDYYGWLWYPDYEWAPAWVEWRYDNNYIGWAPLHPYAYFSVSIGIHFTTVYTTPYHHWHFVNYNHFCHPNVYNYYVGREYRYRIYSGTKYRTNYTYRDGRIQNRGIDIDYVRVRSGQQIKQRELTRVRDSRDIKRDSYAKRDEIRTLDLKRDELVRNDLSRMEIKRENRKTNLNLDKIEIGRRDVSRDDNRTDRNKERMDNNRSTDRIRKGSTEITREIFEKNQTETRKDERNKSNRTTGRTEIFKKETKKNDRSVDRNKVNNERRVQSEQKNKVNDNIRKNETKEIRTPTRENRTEVKRENTRTTQKEQVIRKDSSEKVNTNTNQDRKTDSRKNTSRTNSKNNTREIKRR